MVDVHKQYTLGELGPDPTDLNAGSVIQLDPAGIPGKRLFLNYTDGTEIELREGMEEGLVVVDEGDSQGGSLDYTNYVVVVDDGETDVKLKLQQEASASIRGDRVRQGLLSLSRLRDRAMSVLD